tara:strand:+ start:820 stop:945 length:126 start_codon:yes stop_codon:yes gene_type:complete
MNEKTWLTPNKRSFTPYEWARYTGQRELAKVIAKKRNAKKS